MCDLHSLCWQAPDARKSKSEHAGLGIQPNQRPPSMQGAGRLPICPGRGTRAFSSAQPAPQPHGTSLRNAASAMLRFRPHAVLPKHSDMGRAQSKSVLPLQGLPHPTRRRTLCGSASSMLQDSADVIPSAEGSDSDDDEDRLKPADTPVLVVGAGPVGLITAMYLARRGYPVQMIDKKADPAESNGAGPHEPDYPLILSSRCLLAFQELGATELLNGLASVSLRGRWWVAGAPPGHLTSERQTASSSQAIRVSGDASKSGRASVVSMATPPSTGAAPSEAKGTEAGRRAVLEDFPGWNEKFTRRVLVTRSQLLTALMQEAERLYHDKITLYYRSEFLSIDWDRKAALVATTDTSIETAPPDASHVLRGNSPPPPDEVWVPYGLLVGADGADSAVRQAAAKRKPRITDYDVQRPMRDTRQWKPFDSLPQVPPSGEVVPGMASHGAREYEYVYETAGAPTLRMWVAAPGFVSGTILGVERWESGDLQATLQRAYGRSLPQAWLDEIVLQTCAADSPAPQTFSSTVQCSQFHAPGMALVGDAAHAMTGEYDQGLSCAVEGVRVLNLVLKSTKDNLVKALTLYSEVRCEDVHSMQQLEFYQRSTKPGLSHADLVFRMASMIGSTVWRSALIMMALVRTWLPQRFPVSYVTDRLWDSRRGYSDLLKVVTRFAAVPVLSVVVLVVLAARAFLIARGRLG